jgi:hypothetical protein
MYRLLSNEHDITLRTALLAVIETERDKNLAGLQPRESRQRIAGDYVPPTH